MAKRGSSRENAGEGIGWEVTIMNKESIQLEKELIDTIFELSEESRSNYTEDMIKDLDLFGDLKYDSVSLVDLLISFEEKYDVELTEDMSGLIDNLDAIGKFVDYILGKIQDGR